MQKIMIALAFAVVSFPAFANTDAMENNQVPALQEQTIVQDEVKSPEASVENADDSAIKKEETPAVAQEAN